MGDPVPVLGQQRLVDAELVVERVARRSAPPAARGPSAPGRSGRTWPSTNTITLRSHSVISARPSRLRMNRTMIRAAGDGSRHDLYAVFRYSCAIEVGFRPPTFGVDAVRPSIQYGIHDRRLVRAAASRSCRRSSSASGRSSAATYCLTSASYGLVVEPRGVPGPGRGQRRLEVHVRDAAVAVVDEAHRAVEPVRVAERRLAVVERLALDR